MCKVWWMLQTPRVPPALPMHSAAPAVLLQVPLGPALPCWNQGSLHGKWRRTTLITWICGGHSDGLFPGAAGPQHQAASVSAEQIFVQSPHVILYFINLPEQVSVRPMNTAAGFGWHRFCFFSAVLEAYSLQSSFCCSPTLQTAAHCEIPLRHLIPDRAFSLTDLRRLSAPKNPCRGLWSCWPAQEWGMVRCLLGEETPWLSRKQTQESPRNLFMGRNKGNLSCSSEKTSPLAWLK